MSESRSKPRVLVIEDGDQMAQTREDAVLHWYLDLGTRNIEPAIQESRVEEVSGKQLDGVSWVSTSAQLPLRVLWFDRATGLRHEYAVDLAVVAEEPAFDRARELVLLGLLVPVRCNETNCPIAPVLSRLLALAFA